MQPIKIYDRSFDNCKKAPMIFSLGEGWYGACFHPSLDPKVLAYHVAVKCAEKETEKLR